MAILQPSLYASTTYVLWSRTRGYVNIQRGDLSDKLRWLAATGTGQRPLAAETLALLRIDTVWMDNQPLDMRAGPKTTWARVVQVFGAAHLRLAYLLTQLWANRRKVFAHNGEAVWLPVQRLKTGQFVWGDARLSPMAMNAAPLGALAFGRA